MKCKIYLWDWISVICLLSLVLIQSIVYCLFMCKIKFYLVCLEAKPDHFLAHEINIDCGPRGLHPKRVYGCWMGLTHSDQLNNGEMRLKRSPHHHGVCQNKTNRRGLQIWDRVEFEYSQLESLGENSKSCWVGTPRLSLCGSLIWASCGRWCVDWIGGWS